MLCVRDIMTRQVLTIHAEATLEATARMLSTQHVSGAPVRNKTGALVGVLSKADLADFVRSGGGSFRVEDAMTPGVWAVHPEDSVLDAVRLMVDNAIHRVLVLDRPGHVEGILTTTDVMRALADGRFSGNGLSVRHRSRGASVGTDQSAS